MSTFLSKDIKINPINLMAHIDEIRETLIPPVSNRLLYGDGQLKVMIVGGPNSRKDYHIEEGEELFYQLIGNMDLDIIEQGVPRRISIPQGNFFILPSRIPHSPQRYENTVGIVLERRRMSHEYDGLRWYVQPQPHEDIRDKVPLRVLYEEYFYCTDLGKELAPIITRFFNSETFKTNVPPPDMPVSNPPIIVDEITRVIDPQSLALYLNKDVHSGQDSVLSSTLPSCVHLIFGLEEFRILRIIGPCQDVPISSFAPTGVQRDGSAKLCSTNTNQALDKEAMSLKLDEGDVFLLDTDETNNKVEEVLIELSDDGLVLVIINNILS